MTGSTRPGLHDHNPLSYGGGVHVRMCGASHGVGPALGSPFHTWYGVFTFALATPCFNLVFNPVY